MGNEEENKNDYTYTCNFIYVKKSIFSWLDNLTILINLPFIGLSANNSNSNKSIKFTAKITLTDQACTEFRQTLTYNINLYTDFSVDNYHKKLNKRSKKYGRFGWFPFYSFRYFGKKYYDIIKNEKGSLQIFMPHSPFSQIGPWKLLYTDVPLNAVNLKKYFSDMYKRLEEN